MKRSAAIAILLAGALAAGGCGSSKKAPCLVLVDGNQMCGSAAVTWCQLTNASRESAIHAINNLDDPNFQTLMQAASACADITAPGS